MAHISREKIQSILDAHALWMRGEGGECASLSNFDLTDACLKGTNLQNAEFKNTILQNADLKGANLSNANLEGANLEGADLEGAIMEGASMFGTNLSGAKLRRASLRYYHSGHDSIVDRAYVYENTPTCLREANLRNANLEDADLEGADLERAILNRADLKGANLKGTNLRGADMGAGDLRQVNMTGADLRDTNFSYARLSGAKPIAIILLIHLRIAGLPAILMPIRKRLTGGIKKVFEISVTAGLWVLLIWVAVESWHWLDHHVL